MAEIFQVACHVAALTSVLARLLQSFKTALVCQRPDMSGEKVHTSPAVVLSLGPNRDRMSASSLDAGRTCKLDGQFCVVDVVAPALMASNSWAPYT
eukprot:3571874-Pleurochrysis_carterae.AAC.2